MADRIASFKDPQRLAALKIARSPKFAGLVATVGLEAVMNIVLEDMGPPRARPAPRGLKGGAWLAPLPTPDSFKFLTQAYSLRCDDDFVFTGDWLHGAYDAVNSTPLSITADFFVYCALAQGTILPPDFPWPAFLAVAAKYVVFAFEASDEADAWGRTPFAAYPLRTVGDAVYGSPPGGKKHTSLHEQLLRSVARAPSVAAFPAEALARCGGVAVWRGLVAALYRARGQVGEDEEDAGAGDAPSDVGAGEEGAAALTPEQKERKRQRKKEQKARAAARRAAGVEDAAGESGTM